MQKSSNLLILLGLLITLISIKAQDFQCPEDNGWHRDPKDPHKFYQCVNGRAFEYHCPDNLVFNENNNECDFNVGPTHDPNVQTTDPHTAPSGTRQRHNTTPVGPTSDPNVHTTVPVGPTSDPNVHTTVPVGPTSDPNVHTTVPVRPTSDPNVQTTDPHTAPSVTRQRHTATPASL